MNAEDARVIDAVAAQAEAVSQAIEVIAGRLRDGGRLVYAGAGTSGRLGILDATECPPTFNTSPEQIVGIIAGGHAALTRAVEGAEDHPEFGERDLEAIGFGPKDLLVGIATSGRTPYVLGAIDYARRQGAYTIGFACNADAELNAHVDLAIAPVVGPEVLSGSTRLKAGTATKLVLNMLTTGAMVRLGKTYGNLMVDLRVTNHKLSLRVNRIVRQLTGLGTQEAETLLANCGGELKTALVSHLAGMTPEVARQRLVASGGLVRAVLEQKFTDKPPDLAPISGNELVLGVDGGGTHTVALLARAAANRDASWTLVGRGQAGPSNIQAIGGDQALAALDAAVADAFTAAKLPRTKVAAACIGLAGAGRPADQAFIQDWAKRTGVAAKVEVISDTQLLLAGGTPEGWGIAVVAGTGSMVFARDRYGRTARAGGWGHLLGDEGSGYALALAGLRAVARAADGRGAATTLTQRLLTAMSLTTPQDVVSAVYQGGMDRPALAALAIIVLAAAEQGDAVAVAITQKAADQLATTIAAAARKLGLQSDAVPLAWAGGVFAGSPSYRERLWHSLQAVGLVAEPISPVKEPAEGAVRLALNLIGRN